MGQKVSNANYGHRRSPPKAWGDGQAMEHRRMHKSKDPWKDIYDMVGMGQRPNDAAEKDAQVTL